MKQKLKKVFIVFKTHFDIGYTHLAGEVVDWYGDGMLRDVLEICRATKDAPQGRRYVWTVPAWPLQKGLAGAADPTLHTEAEGFVENGQLVWHALPHTVHTEACGLEDFIRGLYVGRGFEDAYERRVHCAKMTDVPGHTWMLPSLLCAAGVRFLHLGSNFTATPPNVPRLFWWEGPDGSRLLTYYAKGGYGSDLVPPDGWEHPYWLAMLQTLDNLGPQSQDYLEGLFERAGRELPGVELSIGTLDDFADAMLAGDFDIPVVRGDLADSWIRGVGSAPGGVAAVRALRGQAQATEAALSLAALAGRPPASNAPTHLAEAWDKMLLFCEHTWSMDTKVTILPERRYGAPWIGFRFWETGYYDQALFDKLRTTDPGYLKLQESWKEQLGFLADAAAEIGQAQGDLVQNDGTAQLTVWGAQGFSATTPVPLEGLVANESHELVGANGQHHPVYTGPNGLPCADLCPPALGAQAYTVRKTETPKAVAAIARPATGGAVLENEHLCAVVSAGTGTVTSLLHKPTGKQWVAEGTPGLGQYRYDVYAATEVDAYLRDYLYVLRDWGVNDMGKAGYPPDQLHETYTPDRCELAVENGHGWGSVTLCAATDDRSTTRYGNAPQFSLKVSLRANNPFLDFEYHLDEKKPTPFIETGHFTFPLAAESPRYRLNKLGCVLDPGADILDGCNKDLYCAESWTAVEDGDCGLAIFPREMPLYSYETPGALRFERDFEITAPTLLMQAFNNAWGTNFPQWIEGDLHFGYRLYPYAGGWRDAAVWQQAELYRNPPLALPGATAFTLLEEAPPHCRITALKPSRDGKGFILRLHDIGGKAGPKRLTFAVPVQNLWLCSLTEYKQEPLAMAEDGQLEIDFGSFAVRTLYFEPA